MPVYLLPEDEIIFPDPSLARDDGLLAVGGDLSEDRLLLAYKMGIFPWFNEGEEILWWSPDPRSVIFPDKVNISKSMKKFMKKEGYEVRFNTKFEEVLDNCAGTREETWLTRRMKDAYINLYNKSFAMSAECYYNDELVGGLYGVALGKCFFGESMFSIMPNTSKLSLIKLCEKLANEGFKFVDCQIHTKHLESLGAQLIDRELFLDLVEKYRYL